MQTKSLNQLGRSLKRTNRILGLAVVVSALSTGIAAPSAHAAPSRMMSSHGVSATQANRIARRYIGGNAYVVRNEGIYGGMYRIHVHRAGVARHVFVGARTGRVIKTRIINPRADRREDRPRR